MAAPPLTLTILHRDAQRLRRAHEAGDPAAIARAAAHRADAAKPLKVAGAQHVVARERGFASWARARAYLERLDTFGEGLQHPFRSDLDYYEERADGLLASAQDGTLTALAAFAGGDVPLTADGARLAVARSHGFASWPALRRHVGTLVEDGEPFARAYAAIEARDAEALTALLDGFGELATARGTNGNTLLALASTTGSAELVGVLLARGADPSQANAHGWTPLHQAAYSNQAALARQLLEARAPTDASGRGDGGTPLVVALFWGNRAVTDVLAPCGHTPPNLRVAAGLGDLALLGELLPGGGKVRMAAGEHRDFYRPHGGFPAWAPADDPQEIVDEALAWAARNDQVEALRFLVQRGADLDADVYRGTALTWAAATGCVAAVEALVALGADVDARSSFGGPDHGVDATALHLAAGGGRTATVQALLAAGADPTLRDGAHDSTPAGWAEHAGHPAVAALLTP